MTTPNMENPFHAHTDPDRHYIWHRQIIADSEAFIAGDWSMIENDFDADQFEGIRCYGSSNPDDWKIAFATLAGYRDAWLEMSREFNKKKFKSLTNLQAIYARTSINHIEIAGDRALVHKKFTGDLELADGSLLTGSRQTIYRMQKQQEVWKIVGFIGYLPYNPPL